MTEYTRPVQPQDRPNLSISRHEVPPLGQGAIGRGQLLGEGMVVFFKSIAPTKLEVVSGQQHTQEYMGNTNGA